MNSGNSLSVIHRGDTDLHGQQDDRPKDHAAGISERSAMDNRTLDDRLGATYPQGMPVRVCDPERRLPDCHSAGAQALMRDLLR